MNKYPISEEFTNSLIPPENRGERTELPLLSGKVIEETKLTTYSFPSKIPIGKSNTPIVKQNQSVREKDLIYHICFVKESAYLDYHPRE